MQLFSSAGIKWNSFLFEGVSRNVFALGFVSLLTDNSREMIYPLLPLYLKLVLGAGTAFVGLVEGIAESTSSILNLVSGWLSEKIRCIDHIRLGCLNTPMIFGGEIT